jgi:hypothetical protein
MSIKLIGDWGLGIGDWGLGIGPNPQSPIPNPHRMLSFTLFILVKQFLLNICYLIILNKLNLVRNDFFNLVSIYYLSFSFLLHKMLHKLKENYK